MGTFFQAFLQADCLGKWIFLALFTLSCLCWTFLIYKFCLFQFMKQGQRRCQKLLQAHLGAILTFELPNLGKIGKGRFHYTPPSVSILQAIKRRMKQMLEKNYFFATQSQEDASGLSVYLSQVDLEMLEGELHQLLTQQQHRLNKDLMILSTTTTLAPFLGLLGTVWGILITFGQMQQAPSLASAGVLGGLATALTTTVLGLLIAIPSLVGYNLLRALSRHLAVQMERFGHLLLATIELQYRTDHRASLAKQSVE